jgi:hypothetical protein
MFVFGFVVGAVVVVAVEALVPTYTASVLTYVASFYKKI